MNGIELNSKNRIKRASKYFVSKAERKHKNIDGTPIYDYSKFVYSGCNKKSIIICPIHGAFEKTPTEHLSGRGCPICSENIRRKKLTSSTEYFISKAKRKHTNDDGTPIYDYSKTKYLTSKQKVTITCKIHGDFEQKAGHHLSGSECPKCARLKITNKTKLSSSEFFDRAKKIFPDYDYVDSKYFGMHYFVNVKCKIHGEFEVLAHSLLNGCGCPFCLKHNKSKTEQEIFEFIQTIYHGEIQQSNRTILLNNRELDIYIPKKNIAIEYNGLYWHSEIYKSKNYHLRKTQECLTKGIQLIHIFEDEWINKQEIVKSRLRTLLGVSKYRLGARKCSIRQLTIAEERTFLNNNHLQGYVGSRVCYGLTYTNNNKEYIVAAMSFGPLRKNLGSSHQDLVYEMYRFACAKNFSIVGGASKLFKHFLKHINTKQVISYADRRWSLGNLYKQLGFEFIRYTEPSYFYVDGQTRINRFAMRKDILVSKYGCLPEMTEHDFCLDMGFYQIYDCGNLKFEWKNI